MEGQGTDTLKPGAYDLRGKRLESTPLSSFWATLITPSLLVHFRDGGEEIHQNIKVRQLNQNRGLPEYIVAPKSTRSHLQKGSYPAHQAEAHRLSSGLSHHICYYYLSAGNRSLRDTLWAHFGDSHETCHHWAIQCPLASHSPVQRAPALGW